MAEPFRFLVDESSLRLPIDATPQDVTATLELLVARIQEVHESHEIAKFSLIWDEPIGAHLLYDWLFTPGLGVDPVSAAAVRDALSRMPDWDSIWTTEGLPSNATIAAAVQEATSVAAAVRETSQRRSTACLSATPSRSGPIRVQADHLAAEVHFIGGISDVLNFFRAIPEVDDLDEEQYFRNAHFAFPNLHFVRERTRFNHFNEAYASVRVKVTKHLSVLNDHAHPILSEATPTNVKEARLGALGVSASGESAQTRANRAAMKEREVSVGGQQVVCDWHTKLRPHLDRIYFNATSQRRVVVGVFRDHLS